MSEKTSNTPPEKEKPSSSTNTKERENQKIENPAQIAKRKFEEAKKKLSRIQGERGEREQAAKEVEAGTNTEPGKKDKKPESKEDEGAKKEEEKALKETLDSLGGKHKTEIQEALSAKKLGDIDTDARNIAHNELIYSLVPEQKKTDVREKLEKDKTFQQLSQIQKDEKIQQQVLSNLGKLPSDLQKTLLLDADKRGDTSELSETLQKQFGVTPEQSDTLLPQLLDEKNVRDTLLKNIQENGMLVAGVQQNTPLGKELTGILYANVGEYLGINPAQERIVDVENFKGLKDVLGGGYEDLLYSKEFILGEHHPLKKSRDTIKAGFEDEVAQIPEVDPKDSPEKVQEYKKSVEKAFTNATGVEGNKAEKALQKMSHQNVSPLIRFLADLFAPIGALMDGKTGDFWRGYLNQRGADAQSENSTSNANYEQYGSGSGGIEGLQAGTILSAANKYMGVNEQKDGNLIRDMHKSAGYPQGGPSTPWCMSFVQHVLRKDMGYSSEQIGIGPSPSAAAGHRIGRHTDSPQLGDIVLVGRSGGSGRHIAFFAGFDGDRVKLLGGNQSNSVCVTTYPKRSVVEYRTLQKDTSPTPAENGKTSGTAEKPTSGMDNFPNTILGKDKYPSREFLKKNGMTPENVPMGMRVNNPLNIKFNGSAVQRKLFEGVLGKSEHDDQGDPQVVFSSPEAGLASGIRLLLYKQKEHNLNTIHDIIASTPWGWTQGGDGSNPMGNNAAREISQRVGIGLNEPLNLNNQDVMKKFIQELIIQEHGSSGKVYFPILAGSISKVSH